MTDFWFQINWRGCWFEPSFGTIKKRSQQALCPQTGRSSNLLLEDLKFLCELRVT